MLHLWPTSLRFRKIIFPHVIVEKAPFEPRNISHFRFNCVVLRRISIFLALPKNVKVCRKSACASEMFSTKNNQLDKNKIKDASLRLPSASLAPLLLNILASLIIHALFKIRPTSFFFFFRDIVIFFFILMYFAKIKISFRASASFNQNSLELCKFY